MCFQRMANPGFVKCTGGEVLRCNEEQIILNVF